MYLLKKLTLAILIYGILIYRKAVSPILPSQCRFHPSCSQYALDALYKYGIRKGLLKTILRLVRCQPLHPGGYDPA